MGDKQAAVTLSLAARQHHQRPEQPFAAGSFQPDKPDRACVVGKFEEETIGLGQIAIRKPCRVKRQPQDIKMSMSERRKGDPAHKASRDGPAKSALPTR